MINKIDFIFNKNFLFYKTPSSSVPHFILNTEDRYGCVYCKLGIIPLASDGELPDEDWEFSDKTINMVLDEYVNKKCGNTSAEDNLRGIVISDKERSMTFNTDYKHAEFSLCLP